MEIVSSCYYWATYIRRAARRQSSNSGLSPQLAAQGVTEYAILKKGRENRQVRSQDLAIALSGIGRENDRHNQGARKTRDWRLGEALLEGDCSQKHDERP